MALSDLDPVTRIEAILNGDDIDPVTRVEYFMQKAATEVPKPESEADAGKVPVVNSDGDGYALEEILPPYSAEDAGKVLALGQVPVWETVVPLQTVTFDTLSDSPLLTGSLMSQIENGDLCRMTVNGVTEEITATIGFGLTMVSGEVYSMQYSEATGSSFTADVDGEYTVKLERKATTAIAPVWADITDIIPPANGEDF